MDVIIPDHPLGRRQQGLALPVVLIILAVMLVSCVFLIKSIYSTTLNTSTLAYDATLTQSVDLGLHTGFEWLRATSVNSKSALNVSNADNGYVAVLANNQTERDAAFWTGSKTVTSPEGNVEYVIHRICAQPLAYNDAANQCMQTDANNTVLGTTTGAGTSLAVDAATYAGTPQLHYVITARLRGAKGTSVTNQMIVLIGA